MDHTIYVSAGHFARRFEIYIYILGKHKQNAYKILRYLELELR